MSATFKDIGVTSEGHVGIVEIQRPPHNFFDNSLINQIADAFEAFDRDMNIRAYVLCAQGKSFCAGADFANRPQTGAAETGKHLYKEATRLFRSKKPSVGAIQGPAIGGGRLNGKKVPVADGDSATFAIVLAKSSLVLVDLSQNAVTKRRVETIDPARKHAELTFDGASAELLGAEGEGWSLLERLYDAAAVYFAFAQVGGAEAAMWMARDYALQRQAFGRAIGSYQAIKHKLADCYVKLELARSNAYYGAMMLTDGGADLPLAAAAARIAATDAYDFASKENIQTHGGIGFTWEADTQFHYRRARVMALALGGPMAWKDKLVSRLEQKNAA